MKKKWTEQEAAGLLQEQSVSGQSKKEFCAARDIHPATFYYWQRRHKAMAEEPEAGGFSPLRLAGHKTIEVQLDGGRWLALRSTDERELALVLRALCHA